MRIRKPLFIEQKGKRIIVKTLEELNEEQRNKYKLNNLLNFKIF